MGISGNHNFWVRISFYEYHHTIFNYLFYKIYILWFITLYNSFISSSKLVIVIRQISLDVTIITIRSILYLIPRPKSHAYPFAVHLYFIHHNFRYSTCWETDYESNNNGLYHKRKDYKISIKWIKGFLQKDIILNNIII